LPVSPEEEKVLRKFEQRVASLEARIKAERARAKPGGNGGGSRAGQGVLAVRDLPGVVVDDTHAKKVGHWMESTYSATYIGSGYVHDQDADKGEKTLTFQPEVLNAGSYEVWLAYSSGPSRASAVPVTVFSADGEKTVQVDMSAAPEIEGRFVSLGRYRFEKNG